MKMRTLWKSFPLIFAAAIVVTSCATQSSGDLLTHLPGFFKGLLHGFIILFSFIASLFTEFKIYAFPNTGSWYDFGFLLGVMFFFGGSGAGASR